MIFSLLLYSKIKPHRQSLFEINQRWFKRIEWFFDFCLSFLNKFFKPVKIGDTLSIDSSLPVLLIVLLILMLI